MRPWHLIPSGHRDHVMDALRNRLRGLSYVYDEWGNTQSEATRAAIALLEAAAPYGDEDLAVRCYWWGRTETIEHVIDWIESDTGVLLYVDGAASGVDRSLVIHIDRCEPITPAADSLLRALRGDE